MAVEYQVQLVNSTKVPYHFGIYQEYPKSAGLQSVAWQIARLADGAEETVSWKLNYSVAITDWDAKNNIYKGKLTRPAELKKTYEVKLDDTDIPNIGKEPIGDATDGHIVLANNTSEDLKMGFGIDGKLLVIQNGVIPGESSEFYVHPTYYIACFRSIKLGQMVDAGVVLKPVELKFEDGYTSYKVEAVDDAGKNRLMEPVPIRT